jgi:hypothetical protein
MKLRIKVSQAPPDPRFVSVARIIAKGKAAPKWLAIGLQSFSEIIASERSTLDEQHRGENAIEQMHDAADKLIKWLPFFSHLPGIECPDDVAVTLDVLLRIKKMLAYTMQTQRGGGGPRPNIQRQFCAAVVVEAWRLVRPKFQPRSLNLYDACAEYWQTCSGEDRALNKWREDVELAANKNYEAIRKVLVTLRDRESGG